MAQAPALSLLRNRLRRRHRMTARERREAITFYLLISPFLFGFLALTLGPMVASFVFSFARWDLISAPQWVGFSNYTNLAGDPDYLQGIKVTLSYAAMALPTGFLATFTLSLLLNREMRGVNLFRAIFYMPALFAGITVATLWIWVFDTDHGILNNILRAVHLPTVAWLTDPNWALRSFVLMGIWGAGGGILIYLAGLKGIPQQLYEAAQIDGAGAWQRFWHVTIPMLTPTIFFNLVTGLVGVFQYFDQSYVMTNGGPPVIQGDQIVGATKFYMLKLYDDAFGGGHAFGYAAAQAVVLFLFIMAVTLLVVKTSGSWVYYEGSVVKGK